MASTHAHAASAKEAVSKRDVVHSYEKYLTRENNSALILFSNQMLKDLLFDINSVVIDNGSGSIKAGIAGDDRPKVIFPNIVGRRRLDKHVNDATQTDTFIGHKSLKTKDVLSIRYPMEHGIVTNWDDMIEIWHHTFHNELHVQPNEIPCLLTEAPFTPFGNREKMMQVLFEHFQVPATYIADQGSLAYYYLGRTVGVILESGDGVTYTAVIYEGRSLKNVSNRIDFAGRDLTDMMVQLLGERNYAFTTTAEREIVRDIKEKFGYVAFDFDEEILFANRSSRHEQRYTLPDGQDLVLANECFRCTETLFRPSIVGKQQMGLAELLCDTIKKCDSDLRLDLCCNILLSGGTTMFPGFAKRLEKEMKKLLPSVNRIRILASPDRNISVWIGGSILCSLSTFQTMWITNHDYYEFGPSIVHRKCQ